MESGEIDGLIAQLEGNDCWAQKEAVLRLVQIGKPAVPALIRALGSKSFWFTMKRNAADALGGIGDPSAVPALIEALGDKYEVLRRVSAHSLGRIGDPYSVPALIEALGDEDEVVRLNAAEALGKSAEFDPRTFEDLRSIANAARKAKKEGKPMKHYPKIYAAVLKKLNERAQVLMDGKKFPVPKVEKPDKTERVLRVRRLG